MPIDPHLTGDQRHFGGVFGGDEQPSEFALPRHQTRRLEILRPYSQSGTVTMGPGLVETDVKSDAVGELTAGQLLELGWSVDPDKNVWVFTELYKEQPAAVAG